MPLRPIAPHYTPSHQPLKPFVPAIPILTRCPPSRRKQSAQRRLLIAIASIAIIIFHLAFYALSHL